MSQEHLFFFLNLTWVILKTTHFYDYGTQSISTDKALNVLVRMLIISQHSLGNGLAPSGNKPLPEQILT